MSQSVQYISVTFCRIISGSATSANAVGYDINSYVPATFDAQGNVITPAINSPLDLVSSGTSGAVDVIIEDIPGSSVIDLYSIKSFNRFYNSQTKNYESSVLEVLIEGMGVKYIRMNSGQLETYLLALNTP